MKKYIIGLVIFSLLIVTPVGINAQAGQSQISDDTIVKLILQILKRNPDVLRQLLLILNSQPTPTPTPARPVVCPMFSPPVPGWCANGRIVSGGTNANGCALPPRCVRSVPTPTPTGNLSITGVSGPTSLSVGQTGTWRVNVTAPAGSQLSYNVFWGDEVMYDSAGSGDRLASQSVVNTGTFTHTYTRAGTYTVTFGVSRDTGIRCITTPCPSTESAQTSMTVVVGGDPKPTPPTPACRAVWSNCSCGYVCSDIPDKDRMDCARYCGAVRPDSFPVCGYVGGMCRIAPLN